MSRLKSLLMGGLLAAMFATVTSCDDVIYENEGDCTPKVHFIFKKHRQALHSPAGREADVFYSTIESVHLFVYDLERGDLVFDKTEKTENLKSAADLNLGSGHERCYMPLDVPPGRYRIIAWCGLDENDENNAFSLNNDISRAATYAHCSVKHSEQTGRPVNHEKYQSLYHGQVQSVDVSFDGTDAQIIPIELTKNNNDIAVWIQHASKTFSEGEYEVVYTDANGTMHFEDNSIVSNERLEYHPHTTALLSTDTEYNGSILPTSALVAHISTARLMEAAQDDARLEVRTSAGDVVFSIPFIKYVVEMQTLSKDGQYYLDCEDTYNCSFYLTGEGAYWLPARIIINDWVIVPGQDETI